MSNPQLLSIVAMAGWLILSLSAYRSHRVGARRTVVYGFAWAALFFGAFAAFSWIGG